MKFSKDEMSKTHNNTAQQREKGQRIEEISKG